MHAEGMMQPGTATPMGDCLPRTGVVTYSVSKQLQCSKRNSNWTAEAPGRPHLTQVFEFIPAAIGHTSMMSLLIECPEDTMSCLGYSCLSRAESCPYSYVQALTPQDPGMWVYLETGPLGVIQLK